MNLRIRHILPHYPDRVHVQWGLEDPVIERLEGVTFEVQRSGSPGGPWETRSENITDPYYTDLFRDGDNDETEEHLLSLSKQIWYRVHAQLKDGEVLTSPAVDNFGTIPALFTQTSRVGLVPDADHLPPDPQTIFSPNPGMQKRLQLIQRSVQRNAILNLQYFSGVYVAVLKRKSFGTRCTNCFDQASKSIMLSNCQECYGTGWVGGYYTPLLVTAKVQESPVQSQIEQSTKTEIVQSQIELLDFPRLKKNDVLVEVDSNRRWIVGTVADRSLRRRRLTQHVTCTELSRTAAQYSVSIDRQKLLEKFHADPF